MLGPIEGLKVLIEVDATQAQAVLREFSGTVVQTAATTNAATGSSISKFDDLFKQIDDTKQRATELETAMRGVASGTGAAASGAGALSGAASVLVPILGAIVAIGIGKVLLDAAMSTDEMKSAMDSLGTATTAAKKGIGGMIVDITGLDKVTRAAAGALQLLADSMPKDEQSGLGAMSGFGPMSMLFRSLELAAPGTYSPGKVGLSDEAYQADLLMKSLAAAAAETKKFNAEQAKLAEQAARNKKETDALIASTNRYAESLNDQYWTLQGLFQLVDEETAKNQSKQEGFFGGGEASPFSAFFDDGAGGYGISGYISDLDAMGESLDALQPTFEQLTSQLSAMDIALQANVEGFTQMATAAIMSALAGEKSWKQAINQLAKSMVAMNLGYMIQNIAMGIMASTGAGSAIVGGTPPQFFAAATQFGLAAAAWGVIASATGGFKSASGGGGGGGKGHNDIKPAPTILAPEKQAQITIIIDGNVIGQDEYIRELALEAARQMKKAGA